MSDTNHIPSHHSLAVTASTNRTVPVSVSCPHKISTSSCLQQSTLHTKESALSSLCPFVCLIRWMQNLSHLTKQILYINWLKHVWNVAHFELEMNGTAVSSGERWGVSTASGINFWMTSDATSEGLKRRPKKTTKNFSLLFRVKKENRWTAHSQKIRS